jgi:hypothetical protein
LSERDEATIGEGTYLSDDARKKAVGLRVQLEARAGQFAEALAWFDILKSIAPVGSEDPLKQTIAGINKTILDSAPFAVPATIADGPWQHAPFHRTFTFQSIQGAVDHFTLRCDRQSIESSVSEKAQWTIPKSFGDCRIYVFGAPGSSFHFVEAS